MNTRVLMTASALLMLVVGLAATFLPQEISTYSGSTATGLPVLVIQVAGALYLGFAALNWMARSQLMGGIYGRPLALGNFMHFMVAALALVKSILGGQRASAIVIIGVLYLLFAVLFGRVLITNPRQVSDTKPA